MPDQDKNGCGARIKGAGKKPVSTLPVITGSARARPSLSRHTIPAHFLSQLIAEKNHMAVQRHKRRAPTNLANEAYRASGRIALRHMPAGYGLTEIA